MLNICFLKIKIKSVGSKINVNVVLLDDKNTSDIEIDLDDIDVQIDEEHTNVIQVNDDIKLLYNIL